MQKNSKSKDYRRRGIKFRMARQVPLLLGLFFLSFAASSQNLYQDCLGNMGCTDPANTGVFSTTAGSLSYDNAISTFHSTMIYAEDGTIKIWGELTNPQGTSSTAGSDQNWFGVPTIINKTNFPDLEGNPVKIAAGSYFENNTQFILVTDNNRMWTWGSKGVVLSSDLTPSSVNFQEVGTGVGANFQALGLPAGVTYDKIKMLFGSTGTLALTTCDGDVYVLSQNSMINQSGGANPGNNSTQWVHIQKSATAGDYLTGVIAVRGNGAGLIALDKNGNLWTWGYGTRLGNTTNGLSNRQYATQMALPSHSASSIKMIGATKNTSGRPSASNGNNFPSQNNFDGSQLAYYVLYEDGALYAMGYNEDRELGNFSTANGDTWLQPLYADGGAAMNDIAWISPQEHDWGSGFINVITKLGGTRDGVLLNWGSESGSDLGRASSGNGTSTTNSAAVDPGTPDNWETGHSNEKLIYAESGGHTTLMLQECFNTFGYIGHIVRGSMGDGAGGGNGSTSNVVHFTTNALEVCGIQSTPGNLKVQNATGNNVYCNSDIIQLVGSPAGTTPGGYSIISVDGGTDFLGLTIDPASGKLDPTQMTFSGNGSSHTVRLGYIIPAGSDCANSTVELVITITSCQAYDITIPGEVWIDGDGDALLYPNEDPYTNSGLFAVLVDPNGVVLASVPVDPVTGKYEITVSNHELGVDNDNYRVVLSNTARTPGTPITVTGATLPAGYYYTGTNRGNASGPDVSNKSGWLQIGNLSVYNSPTQSQNVELDAANFGVNINTTVAVNDENSTWVNTPVKGNVLTNDFDPQGDAITFEGFVNPAGGSLVVGTPGSPASMTVPGVTSEGQAIVDAGTLTINDDGSYTFNPKDGFVGTVNIPYQIQDNNPNRVASDQAVLAITVSPLPGGPDGVNSVIANNDEYSMMPQQPGDFLTGNVMDNDQDPQTGDQFQVIGFGQGGNLANNPGSSIQVSGVDANGKPVTNAGSLIQNADGTFTFVPVDGFTGTVTYQYKIEDNHWGPVGSNPATPNATDVTTVVITVNPFTFGINHRPDAGDDFIIVDKNGTGTGNFIANDSDPDGNTLMMNFDDQFYNIDPDNTSPSIMGTKTTENGGTVVFYDNGTYTYTPAPGFDGPDLVTYEVCDKSEPRPSPLCSQATIHMLVPPTSRVLPIELISFEVVKNGNHANLSWATATESNNAGFNVMHSADGQNWNAIGHVNSKGINGNSSSKLNYSFVDENPSDGINYYRLIQKDLDGNSSVSEIKSVNFDKATGITVYPNPVSTVTTVKGLTGNERLRVYDANGRIVKDEKANGSQRSINFTNLSSGTYRIQVISTDGSLLKTISVIKGK